MISPKSRTAESLSREPSFVIYKVAAKLGWLLAAAAAKFMSREFAAPAATQAGTPRRVTVAARFLRIDALPARDWSAL
jgi:hypothetical protein